MYQLNQTITAVSSPSSAKRVVVRITGPDTAGIIKQIFNPAPPEEKNTLTTGTVTIDSELKLDASLYFFPAPISYTGQTLAEIHLYTNSAVTSALIDDLLKRGLRTAGPGEFTARAYLNGKIDLAQAEAVNEIVSANNTLQLHAAQKLLQGKLAKTTAKIHQQIIECLTLIEASLDFSDQDIELISTDQATERLEKIKQLLEKLLADSIRSEAVVELPSVGIAGAPNAGKSTLLNKLLGTQRSIVSHTPKTTRDVLTGLLNLKHSRCVLFDCAGLITKATEILDRLAQKAALEAIKNASIVIFCIDISKTDWTEDLEIRKLTNPETCICVATKEDSLSRSALNEKLSRLERIVSAEIFPISAKTNTNIDLLKQTIDEKLIGLSTGKIKQDAGYGIALTARHKNAVTNAIANIREAAGELKNNNDEVAAMLLRDACRQLSLIESHPIDEQVLEQIFSRFCIGK